MSVTNLSLQSDETYAPARDSGRGVVVVAAILVEAPGGLGFFTYRILQRAIAAERQLAVLTGRTDAGTALARQAWEKSVAAEAVARAAAEGRQVAEVEAEGARKDADSARLETDAARQEASSAVEAAAVAKAEADLIRKKAAADVDRLESALGQIARDAPQSVG